MKKTKEFRVNYVDENMAKKRAKLRKRKQRELMLFALKKMYICGTCTIGTIWLIIAFGKLIDLAILFARGL